MPTERELAETMDGPSLLELAEARYQAALAAHDAVRRAQQEAKDIDGLFRDIPEWGEVMSAFKARNEARAAAGKRFG